MAQTASSLKLGRSTFQGVHVNVRERKATAPRLQSALQSAAVTKRLKSVNKKTPPPKPAAPPAQNGKGTGVLKKITSISVGQKGAQFRPREAGGKPAPKVLTRVQQLRLLSKLEQAGVLSKLEKSGITLSFIEKSGLLSKAESLGLLSAAADRGTPTAVYGIAALLFAAAAGLVLLIPDDSANLIAVQAVSAGLAVIGGLVAFGGASFLSNLQKDVN